MQRLGLHIPLAGTAAAAIIAAASGADAQTDDSEIIVVDPLPSSDRDRDDDRALAEPDLVTRVRVDAETPANLTLAELVARGAGAQVRSLGGLGAFSSLSVRGLGPSHTAVAIDGVPLSRLAGAIADLSRFELHSFSLVELYRGAAPITLGGAGLGGALNLVTEVGGAPRTALSTGIGSFGARHLRARHVGGQGELGYQLAAGYAGAEGDYAFFDDNGTNLEPGDDSVQTRSNNGFDRLDAVIRARERDGARVARGGARIALQRQGLPGIAGRQTERAGLDTAAGLLDAVVETSTDNLSGRLSGFAMFDRFHLRDPDGEIGIGGGDSLGESLSVGASAAGSRRGEHLELALVALDARVDAFGERNLTTGAAGARGLRLGIGLGLQARYAPIDAIALVPSVRIEVLDTRPRGGSPEVEARTDVNASPRLAALWRASPDLSVKASAGYAVRQPTLVELFGDRGYAAGNPMLLPEHGAGGDLGAVWLPADPPGLDRLFVEIAGFWSRLDDAIVYFPTAGQVARPFNVGGARIAGVESTVQASWRRWAATASYTLTAARDRDSGNPLPHRARHQIYGRLDARWWRLRAWVDASHASGNVVDRAGIVRLPPRTFAGAGLSVEVSRWLELSAEGKNLAGEMVERVELDPAPRPDLTSSPRAVSDFFGYPLPGRAFYVSARAVF